MKPLITALKDKKMKSSNHIEPSDFLKSLINQKPKELKEGKKDCPWCRGVGYVDYVEFDDYSETMMSRKCYVCNNG